ncbi:MAG: flippase-like domain-containing protein [Candidatus Tectomicrobia bacterium]|nr:flippase-like domain-containing protein [Candidatus Tectomicrobia bacterium]
MRLNLWIGIALSAVIMWLLLRSIDLASAMQALAQADYRWLLPAFLIALLSFVLRALRWQAVFAAVQPVRFRGILAATMIGFMGNMLLPARLGEFIRAYLIGRKEAVGSSTALATVVVERMFDGFVIILIWLLVVLFFEIPPGFQQWERPARLFAIGSGAFYVVLLAGCLVLKHHTETVLAVVRRLCRPLPQRFRSRLVAGLGRFAAGLAAIRANRQLVAVSCWSLLLWVVISLANYPVIRSFHVDVPPQALFLLMVFQAFAVMLPSSPGYVGTFHLASITALQVFGVGRDVALSIAIVLHLSAFLVTVVPGLCFLWSENLSLRSLNRLRDAPPPILPAAPPLAEATLPPPAPGFPFPAPAHPLPRRSSDAPPA